MSIESLAQNPRFIIVAAIAGIVGIILATASFLFAWGKYSATADRLREVMERNQDYELRELVEAVVRQEIAKTRLDRPQPDVPAQAAATPGASNPLGPQNPLNIEFPQARQRFRSGEVISPTGRHALPVDTPVWILLSDTFGNFYLQNPPVTLDRNGSWSGRNVNLGQGISELLVVRVTSDGDREFQQKVLNREWGAFTRLPRGTDTLDRRQITVQ